jgi:hypothetical protein
VDYATPVPSRSMERHVAQSVRLALEADLQGADSFNIAAADTTMERPSRDLMAEVFPDVPVDDGVTGTDTFMSIDKAHRLATRSTSREGSCSDGSGDTRRDQPASLSFVPRHDELRRQEVDRTGGFWEVSVRLK